MARKQHSELTAGIFTILATILLVGVIFWLGAADIFKPAAQEAWFYVKLGKGQQGLKPGAQVKMTDVEVGKVAEVRLDLKSGRTFYIVQLFDKQTEVYSDAKASVNTALVGGGASLQILHCGGKTSDKLAGEKYPAEIQPGDLDKMLSQFESLGGQISGLLKTISGEMDKARDGSAMHKVHAMMDVLEASLASIRKELDAGNKAAMIAKLHQTVEHLRDIAADAKPRVKSALTGVDTMIAKATPKVNKLLDGAGELVDEFKKLTKGDIANIISRLHDVSKHVLTIAGNFAKLSEGASDIVSVNRENIDEIIDNMGQVATNLKSASKEIRRNPWRLLYRPKKGEMHSQNIHDAARSFSNGAAQLDQALAKLKGLAAAHPKGIPAADPQLKKIAEQIKETFEKFTDAEKALWKELLK
ncbi:MAG: MlaD family protein [Phycisphaerae bacterium]|jgi:ABC-type transporter Mla subunit MlaD|nr:MlaD family protein [Phycisphaerae bacterium]